MQKEQKIGEKGKKKKERERENEKGKREKGNFCD